MNRRTFLKSLVFAGGATLAGGSAYALHSVDLQISHQQLPTSGLDRTLRVVALSDLHAPCYYISLPDLIRTINAQNPRAPTQARPCPCCPFCRITCVSFVPS